MVGVRQVRWPCRFAMVHLELKPLARLQCQHPQRVDSETFEYIAGI